MQPKVTCKHRTLWNPDFHDKSHKDFEAKFWGTVNEWWSGTYFFAYGSQIILGLATVTLSKQSHPAFNPLTSKAMPVLKRSVEGLTTAKAQWLNNGARPVTKPEVQQGNFRVLLHDSSGTAGCRAASAAMPARPPQGQAVLRPAVPQGASAVGLGQAGPDSTRVRTTALRGSRAATAARPARPPPRPSSGACSTPRAAFLECQTSSCVAC